MAQRVTLNQRPAVRAAAKSTKPSRLPAAIAMCVGAALILGLSLLQVGRISPRRGDVNGIVRELKKDRPASSLPSRIDPTHGAKLWLKKGPK